MADVSLRRYTNLAGALHIVRNSAITLLPYRSWDDRNDVHYLCTYQRRKRAKSVLALCFARAAETYHHWKIFSPGCDGVCIEFNQNQLVSCAREVAGITAREMQYVEINRVDDVIENLDELPFTKRQPYFSENEFRLVYVNYNDVERSKAINIELSYIHRITISPWIPKCLFESIRDTIKDISKSHELRICHSTLINNKRWKNVADACPFESGNAD